MVEVVEGAGPNLDCIMLPKVQGADQIAWLDLTLTQIEKTIGLPVGGIGIEAQIENARGLVNVDAIAGRVAPGGDDHLRAGRLHGIDQHEVARGRRAATRTTRATRTTTS